MEVRILKHGDHTTKNVVQRDERVRLKDAVNSTFEPVGGACYKYRLNHHWRFRLHRRWRRSLVIVAVGEVKMNDLNAKYLPFIL